MCDGAREQEEGPEKPRRERENGGFFRVGLPKRSLAGLPLQSLIALGVGVSLFALFHSFFFFFYLFISFFYSMFHTFQVNFLLCSAYYLLWILFILFYFYLFDSIIMSIQKINYTIKKAC